MNKSERKKIPGYETVVSRVLNVDENRFSRLCLDNFMQLCKNQQKYSINYFSSFLRLSKKFIVQKLSSYKPQTLITMVEEKETMKKVTKLVNFTSLDLAQSQPTPKFILDENSATQGSLLLDDNRGHQMVQPTLRGVRDVRKSVPEGQ